MTATQAERIGTALQKLTELEVLELADLREQRKEAEELDLNLSAENAATDAEYEAMKDRMERSREPYRELIKSLGSISKETNAAIAEHYRRQDELFKRLASLSDKLLSV